MYRFFLVTFNNLSLVFEYQIIVCQGIDFFGIILLGVLQSLILWIFMSFANLGNFQPLFLQTHFLYCIVFLFL